eukprot:CAMPEP_0183378040 /NCGR_PEP_ID=MMETSP0164_2-20130417/124663_1 /TAXON_ID=221442 /ORGANISM="Coccolithus pelagicus ssp braarudi, Strain PLY182g" /LENGTH=137 /DNA_ID=CAMNT_0025555577 /DNA_START=125 /DNA_END=534 /DNA_ORIENTATION=+
MPSYPPPPFPQTPLPPPPMMPGRAVRPTMDLVAPFEPPASILPFLSRRSSAFTCHPTGSSSSPEMHNATQVTHMYHEQQLSALCGVHALNNLMQGPFFGAGDLGEIAARLDLLERELLDAATASYDDVSNHVDPATG